MHQARLPHPGLPDHGHHLTVARPGLRLSLANSLEFRLPPHKGGQPTCCAGLQTAADRTGPGQLAYLDRLAQPLDRNRPRV